MIREVIRVIQEKYINNSSTEKEWILASKGYLPLTPTIMAEFSKEVETAYHVTDEDGLNTLKKIQGQKKEISTFKRGGPGISYGARTSAFFLVELSGISSFSAEYDIYSQLSRNGYKWLDPIRTDKEYTVNNLFSVPMNKKMMKYFKVKDRFSVQSAASAMSGPEKQKFIKWYFDESKKLITKKLIGDIRDAIADKRNSDSEWSSDEWFLHKIKVKEVKIIDVFADSYEPTKEKRKELITKLGFKYAGVITRKEVEHLDAN